jgi:arabinoxylan arabinofuranohydrolase
VGGGDFGSYNNNHHTLIQFKDSYYLFYHARAVEHAMGVDHNYRSAQVDKATVSNGTITVKATMTGVSPVQTLNPYLTVQAETIHEQGGITVNNDGNSGNTLVNVKTGNWIGVKNVAFTNGATKVTARVSSKVAGAIKICTDSPSGKAVGYIDVPNTNGSFVNLSASVSGLNGTKNLYFVFSNTMDMDSWSFS